jgi:small multidrug resistance pump
VAWLLLGCAITCEITATTALKLSDGLTRFGPVLVVAVGYLLSFVLLARALKVLDVGVAYAIWSGVGTAMIAAIGMLAFGESHAWPRFVFLGFILAGVAGLQVSGSSP